MSGCFPENKCPCNCHNILYGHPEFCVNCECNWTGMIKQIETTTQSYKRNLFNDRVERLEIQNNYQVDENRKTSRRIDQLEKITESLEQKYNHTQERIKELKDKKPHMCPVCEGSGSRDIGIELVSIMAECNACDGEGIVWG
jgi:DnaJ-class molecular chaperone